MPFKSTANVRLQSEANRLTGPLVPAALLLATVVGLTIGIRRPHPSNPG